MEMGLKCMRSIDPALVVKGVLHFKCMEEARGVTGNSQNYVKGGGVVNKEQ